MGKCKPIASVLWSLVLAADVVRRALQAHPLAADVVRRALQAHLPYRTRPGSERRRSRSASPARRYEKAEEIARLRSPHRSRSTIPNRHHEHADMTVRSSRAGTRRSSTQRGAGSTSPARRRDPGEETARSHNPRSRSSANSRPAARSQMSKAARLDALVKENQWDFWPEGNWAADYPLEMATEFFFATNWAFEGIGGARSNGDSNAEFYADGRVTRRKCLGYMACENPNCHIIIRPMSKNQLRNITVLDLSTWRARYENTEHGHIRPFNESHLTPAQSVALATTVRENPKVGPSQLLAGRAAVGGPGVSIAELNPLLLNPRRVAYERDKVLGKIGKKAQGANFRQDIDKFISELSPDWTCVVHDEDNIQLVVLQSQFMRQLSIKDRIEEEAVNGIVSDAAHNYFRRKNHYLFVSSVFEPEHLKCWVPIVMSYSNGVSAAHYKPHFLQVYEGLRVEYKQLPTPRPSFDKLSANVVDFSDAQRLGLENAFVQSNLDLPDNLRSEDELRRVAKGLVKGCERHFREQVERVSKISHVISTTQRQTFRNRVISLLNCQSTSEFESNAAGIVKDFPLVEPWMSWWLRPQHRAMLFRSELVMDAELFYSLPATTNAEEAMHHRLYQMVNRDNSLFEGLRGLVAVGKLLNDQFVYAKGEAGKSFTDPTLAVGKRQVRSMAAHIIHGAIHPPQQNALTRGHLIAPLILCQMHAKSRKVTKKPPSAPVYQQSYPWYNNSCWLDSSLTALYAVGSRDPASFERILGALCANQPLNWVYRIICRHTDELLGATADASLLGRLRNEVRQLMVKSPIVRGLKSEDQTYAVFGWLSEASAYKEVLKVQQADPAVLRRAVRMFRPQAIYVRRCYGDPDVSDHAEPHWQLDQLQWIDTIQLPINNFTDFKGKVNNWFLQQFLNADSGSSSSCWRQIDGKYCCDGAAVFYSYIVSLPIVLVLEFVEPQVYDWDIPAQMLPLDDEFEAAGIKYELVAHVYGGSNHFITRYVLPDGRVFDYDGMANGGRAIHNTTASFERLMTGRLSKLPIPPPYQMSTAIYRLVGGEPAQQRFQAERIKNAPFGLQFHRLSDGRTLSHAELQRPEATRLENRPWTQGRSATRYTDLEPESEDMTSSSLSPAPASPAPDDRMETADTNGPQLADLSAIIENAVNSKPANAEPYDLGPYRPVRLLQCGDCRNWTHWRCLPAGVDWERSENRFRCLPCVTKSVERTSLRLGDVQLQPLKLTHRNVVLWAPAELININLHRHDREYQWRWLEDIVWSDGERPTDPLHHSAEWPDSLGVLDSAEGQENKLCMMRAPLAFNTEVDEGDGINSALTLACVISLSQIIQFLAEGTHPIIREFDADNQGVKPGVFIDDNWLTKRSLLSSEFPGLDPGLWATLGEPLRLLTYHFRQGEIDGAEGRAATIAAAFWITLAIQQNLNEPWDLGASTYLDIQAGLLVETPTISLTRKAIKAMQMAATGTTHLVNSYLRWTSPHSVVFYERAQATVPEQTQIQALRLFIPLRYQGRPISYSADLPDVEARPIPKQRKQVRFAVDDPVMPNIPPKRAAEDALDGSASRAKRSRHAVGVQSTDVQIPGRRVQSRHSSWFVPKGHQLPDGMSWDDDYQVAYERRSLLLAYGIIDDDEIFDD
ncbi:hypothetical protein MIND_01234200 [Mycena indigotica]|uniref:Uncharacterized protein n=1 Tax=Mycena indigotica TaxID=2126181 RepID=A0A8H6S3L3_9AGAR|nr:uncharacterized protein MIND_01234200 [Mycena indigotica]KAF7292078.1 hypothetical protein MIND_01234200 [Mycena indigotica]